MRDILMAIHPRHAENILKGIKTFELRKAMPKRPIGSIHLYATAPVKAIVGVLMVKQIHQLPLDELWELTRHSNGISWQEFCAYFGTAKQGVAYEVKWAMRYATPVTIEFKAPQSYRYVSADFCEDVEVLF